MRWETDARPGLHLEGPQVPIDELMQIADSDVVVGIFWKRSGTPSGDAQSGTEHELRDAWEAWRKAQERQTGRDGVLLDAAGLPDDVAELEQWHRVVKFREELPKEQLWWSYATPVEFERLVRGHLEDVVLRRTENDRLHWPRRDRSHRTAAREPPAAATRTGGTSVTKLWFGVPAVVAAISGREDELDAVEEALAL